MLLKEITRSCWQTVGKSTDHRPWTSTKRCLFEIYYFSLWRLLSRTTIIYLSLNLSLNSPLPSIQTIWPHWEGYHQRWVLPLPTAKSVSADLHLWTFFSLCFPLLEWMNCSLSLKSKPFHLCSGFHFFHSLPWLTSKDFTFLVVPSLSPASSVSLSL